MQFTITPLLVGLRSADQGIMTYQNGYGTPIWLPMWSFLLKNDSHTILVDTGLDDFMIPEEFTEQTGMTPQYMEDALEEQGIDPEDVDIVVNTHLHDDHCANNPLFEKATVYVQQKELEFCREPHPLDGRYDDFFLEGLNVVPLEGDKEILPGLSVLFTPGHTPGSQTVQVATPDGQVIIPGMCSNEKNFPGGGQALCPGVHCDAIMAYDSAQKVAGMEGCILPLHELSIREILSKG